MASGWMFMNADKPANIREEDSETPWLTTPHHRFHRDQAKPPGAPMSPTSSRTGPISCPRPTTTCTGPNHVPAAVRPVERSDPHPVYGAFMDNRSRQAFQQEEVREKVIPAYMGLIKQCDDQLGRLLDHLEATGRMEDTMIVLTSDHGDYLGDHWLGEKDLFHEPSVKIPMIVYDPRPEADATRGTTCDALVESIDLAATFVEAAGGGRCPTTSSRAAR
jgi:arylsulfatase A-like enzyme